MNLISHLIQRRLKLPAPLTRDIVVHRDLRAPMPDGVELLADRWAPRHGGDGLPTALIRTPYGRAGLLGTMMARPLAERGYQVLVQSTRGGFGSGGDFDPMRQERADGLATLDWTLAQPWFGDSIVLFGLSYLGYVQWAVADQLPPQVKALIPIVTESALTLEFLRADGMSLETPFAWGVMVAGQERPLAMLRQFGQGRRTDRALRTLPLNQADVAAIGQRSQYIQDILAHTADAPRWDGIDHRDRVAGVTAPVSSIAGWYDIFLPGQLRDFRALQDAGRPARLTVGPWTHLDVTALPLTEALEFGLAHARGEQPPARPPGAAVRHGPGRVAGLRILAAHRLLAAPLPPPARWRARRRAERVGARPVPLRARRPDAGRRRRADEQGPRPGGQRRGGGPAGRADLHHARPTRTSRSSAR